RPARYAASSDNDRLRPDRGRVRARLPARGRRPLPDRRFAQGRDRRWLERGRGRSWRGGVAVGLSQGGAYVAGRWRLRAGSGPASELLDQADLIHRYHWAVTDTRIKGLEPSRFGRRCGI